MKHADCSIHKRYADQIGYSVARVQFAGFGVGTVGSAKRMVQRGFKHAAVRGDYKQRAGFPDKLAHMEPPVSDNVTCGVFITA